jgi:hypothetical protein
VQITADWCIGVHADPFQSVQLPEVVEEVLSEGVACSISFNRHGTILAGAAQQTPDFPRCTAPDA